MDLPVRAEQAAQDFQKDLAERYAECVPLRAVVANIPYVGPAIDSMVGTRGQNISQRRILATVAALREEFERCSEERVDREFLESEEFYDLVWRVFEKGQRTKEADTIALFARMFRGAVELPDSRADWETYSSLASDLTSAEMEFALRLTRAGFGDEYRGDFDLDDVCSRMIVIPATAEGFDEADYERQRTEVAVSLSRLEAKGVLRRVVLIDPRLFDREVQARFQGAGSSFRVDCLKERYRISAMFAEFTAWLDRLEPADPLAPEE